MGHVLRLVIALGLGGVGCAAISGLDTLTVGDASRDARACSQGNAACPADQSGCCNSSETCSDAGCCSGLGASCGSSGGCCSGFACTNGGTCQAACEAPGATCQSGSGDVCCRGQAYCTNGACVACVANEAPCAGDSQCCSHHCGNTSKVCSNSTGG